MVGLVFLPQKFCPGDGPVNAFAILFAGGGDI